MQRFSKHLLIICSLLACGANWPNWRGPTGNGVASDGKYPTQWNATENVAWKLTLPGRGASTPVVWEEKIFLTYGKDGQNVLAGISPEGKVLWETAAGQERAGKNRKATGSNPSPITDGKRLYGYFKSGDLICTDLEGKQIWHKNLPKEYGEEHLWNASNDKDWPLWWDLGTSPVLTDSCVVIAVMQSGPSYLLGLDKESGEEVWKQDRNLGAPVEAAQSYTTPVVATDDSGKAMIYVVGADHITGHDGATGKEIWRVGGLNPQNNGYFRSIASPVISGDLLIAPYARGDSITAVRLGGKGDITKSHIAWFNEGQKVGVDVPTPAAHNGRIYLCQDRGEVACLDAKTGREIWREPLEKNRNQYSSSPIVAGGHIYVTREDGKTFVLAAGDKFQLISGNELSGESTVATPVFVNGRILIRTDESLYCIGK